MRKIYLFFLFAFLFQITYSQTTFFPDSCYGENGVNIFSGGLYKWVVAVNPLADGKLLLLTRYTDYGSFSFLKLREDGTLDSSFNNTGIKESPIPGFPASTSSYASSITLADNGSFYFISVGQICKIKSDGSLDNTFGAGGIVTVNTPGYPYTLLSSVSIQQDNKVLISGAVTLGDGIYKGAVWRLLSNGSLDQSFGTNGYVIPSIDTISNFDQIFGYNIKQLSDGKLLVCGRASMFYGPDAGGYLFFMRLLANGVVDNNFGNNGAMIFSNGYNQGWDPMFVFGDNNNNEYIVTSYNQLAASTPSSVLLRQRVIVIKMNNTSGLIDSSYGTNGMVYVDSIFGGFSGYGPYNIGSSFDQATNKLYVMGAINDQLYNNTFYYDTSRTEYAVACLNSDGTPDQTFNNSNGIYSFSRNTWHDVPMAGALLPDGKIIFGGYGRLSDADDTDRAVLLRIENYMIPKPNASFTATPVTGSIISFQYTGSENYNQIQWIFGDGSDTTMIDGTAAISHNYPASGEYNVCVIAYNQCRTDTFCQTIRINTTGVSDLSNALFKIYPNPAQDKVFIEYDANTIYTLKVRDVFGRTLQTFLLTPSTKMIDVSDLSSGLYYLQGIERNTFKTELQTFSFKLIKQ